MGVDEALERLFRGTLSELIQKKMEQIAKEGELLQNRLLSILQKQPFFIFCCGNSI